MHTSKATELKWPFLRVRPPEGAAPDLVHVHCSDGEVFPVKRAVLRPAVALTAAVRFCVFLSRGF